jgi:hypothetical protein
MDKTKPRRGLTTINTTINSFLGRLSPRTVRRVGYAEHHPQPAYKENQNES